MCADAAFGGASCRRERLRRRVLAVLAGVLGVVAACGSAPPFTIENGTAEAVVLVGCAQEPHLDRVIPAHGTFVFTDDVGQRTLSDDPGFACLLKTSQGALTCLRLPTDQSAKTVFAVSDARPTVSFSACVAQSDPHL